MDLHFPMLNFYSTGLLQGEYEFKFISKGTHFKWCLLLVGIIYLAHEIMSGVEVWRSMPVSCVHFPSYKLVLMCSFHILHNGYHGKFEMKAGRCQRDNSIY